MKVNHLSTYPPIVTILYETSDNDGNMTTAISGGVSEAQRIVGEAGYDVIDLIVDVSELKLNLTAANALPYLRAAFSDPRVRHVVFVGGDVLGNIVTRAAWETRSRNPFAQSFTVCSPDDDAVATMRAVQQRKPQ